LLNLIYFIDIVLYFFEEGTVFSPLFGITLAIYDEHLVCKCWTVYLGFLILGRIWNLNMKTMPIVT